MRKNRIALYYLICTLILFSCSDKEIIIGLNENIHHDDFEYSVINIEKTGNINNIKSKGQFYLVTFKLENKAKRVEHKWDNSIAYVVNEKGERYENSYDLQIILKQTKDFNLKEKYITPAGKTESTILVFDIPAGTKEPCLKVNGEFLMGDLFDGNKFKNTKVKLY
jgi:uncharacterized protein DUF4352